MVKTREEKEVASSSATSQKKSKKNKRKSTFYSFPVQPDHEVPESLPPPPSAPKPVHTEAESQNSLESETEVELTDTVDSVDTNDLNFQIKTRKSEAHWYMIYYDGSIDITDDDDSDSGENSVDNHLADQLSFGCTKPNAIHGDEIADEMVCAVSLLC